MAKKQSIAGLLGAVFLVFILLMMISGNGSGIDPDAVDEKVNYRPGVKESEPDSIHVLVDVTGSMRGFSTAGDHLERFLMDVHASFQPKPTYFYSFSRNIRKLENYLPLLNARTYSEQATDYRQLKRLIERTGMAILITDLQFNDENDRIAFTNLLRDNINDQYFIEMLGAKIQFDGRYFPRGGSRDAKYNGLRPVYIFVISENQYRTYITEAIARSDFHTEKLPFYSAENVRVSVLESESDESSYYSDNIGSSHRYKSSLIYDFDKPSVTARLRFHTSRHSQWGKLKNTDIKTNVKIYDAVRDTILSANERHSPNITVTKVGSGEDRIDIDLEISRLKITGYYVVEIKIEPHEPPEWIRDWTVSHSDPVDWQRDHTLYLDRITEDLIRSVLNPYTMVYSFLHISGDYSF